MYLSIMKEYTVGKYLYDLENECWAYSAWKRLRMYEMHENMGLNELKSYSRSLPLA